MNFFSCNLCQFPYDMIVHIPRIMPDCGHTFCQRCIEDRLAYGVIVCPEDDSTYPDCTRIDDFPLNSTLAQILKKNQTTKTLNSNKPSMQTDVSNHFSQRSISSDRQYPIKNLGGQSNQVLIEPQKYQMGYMMNKPNEERILIPKEINKELQKENSQKSHANLTYNVIPQQRSDQKRPLMVNNDEEEELKNLLTPTDFMQKLIGNSPNAIQDALFDEFIPEDKLPEASKLVQERRNQIVNRNMNQQLFPRSDFPRSDNNIDRINVIIDQKEIKFFNQIQGKIEEQILNLQKRRKDLKEETSRIFRTIKDGFQKLITQHDLNIDMRQYQQQAKFKIQQSQSNRITDRQDNLEELMIARYCNIQNGLENSDFYIPIEPINEIEQKTPVFTPKQTFIEDYDNEQDSHNMPYQQFNLETGFPKKDGFIPQKLSPNDVYRPKQNVDFPSFDPQGNNQVTAQKQQQRLPSAKIMMDQQRSLSPSKRIFDNIPSYSPIRMKQPLFKTPISSEDSFKNNYFDQILEKLERGTNIELVNLKDQSKKFLLKYQILKRYRGLVDKTISTVTQKHCILCKNIKVIQKSGIG